MIGFCHFACPFVIGLCHVTYGGVYVAGCLTKTSPATSRRLKFACWNHETKDCRSRESWPQSLNALGRWASTTDRGNARSTLAAVGISSVGQEVHGRNGPKSFDSSVMKVIWNLHKFGSLPLEYTWNSLRKPIKLFPKSCFNRGRNSNESTAKKSRRRWWYPAWWFYTQD